MNLWMEALFLPTLLGIRLLSKILSSSKCVRFLKSLQFMLLLISAFFKVILVKVSLIINFKIKNAEWSVQRTNNFDRQIENSLLNLKT